MHGAVCGLRSAAGLRIGWVRPAPIDQLRVLDPKPGCSLRERPMPGVRVKVGKKASLA